MKNISNRLLCTLLVLCMLLTMVPGVFAAPSATDIVTTPSGYTGAEDVVYKTAGDYVLNWGARGEDCTFLTTYAQDFYTGSNTFESLSALSGGTVDTAPASDLYDALQDLMVDNHTYFTHYGGSKANACKNYYLYTDCMLGNSSYVSTIYRGDRVSSEWNGSTYNQEHVWPNSKCIGDDTTDVGDIMHLRPAIPSENSARGNKAYGASGGTSYYDPGVSVRGDCARTVLYMYVRWGNTGNMWGADGVMESLDVLLDWIEEDPVDTWEMGHNDAVQSITGTRNVFVDYPELAFLLFNEEVPADMTTPGGGDKSVNYTVTAQANNPEWGTVAVSGKTVSATPKEGYMVAGYTVISGNATVTQKGNVFTVVADGDCAIRINFAAREAVRVTYMENGTETGNADVYAGDLITLPQTTLETPEDYTFQGWVDVSVTETTEKPAQIYLPGASVTATKEVTYYALYSRFDTQGSGSSTAFELYSGAPVAGNYLVVTDNGAMTASVTKNRLDITAVNPVGNAIDNPADSIIWELALTADGYVTLYNVATKSYAGGTGAKSQAKLLTSVTDFAKWTAEGDGAYNLLNLGNADKGVNHHLRRNESYGFACYAEGFGTPVTLYKQATGAMYYSTYAAVCEHVNAVDVAASEPTCTEDGYTAGVFCNDCKSYISGHEVIPTFGHDYEAVKVVAPTENLGGYTTYTCSVCGDSYSGDFTEALGKQYTVSFAVPETVAPVADMLCGKNGITLPTAGAVEGYQFIGWTEAPVEDTTEKPTVYTTYTATADTILYALYTYSEGGSGETGWQLVTDAATLSANDRLVLAQNTQGKVAAEISGKYMTDTAAQFSEDGTTITDLPANAVIFTLGGNKNAWTLSYDGKLLGSPVVKTVAWDNGTTTWTISVDETGAATVQNTEATCGRFLYNVQYTRFTTYTSDATVKMLLPQLFRLEGDTGVTYYTTLDGKPDDFEGAMVAGSVIASAEVQGDVTVELSNALGVVSSTAAVDGKYAMEGIMPGTYTLTFRKAGHVSRSYTVEVVRQDVTVSGELCLMGDVNGDGSVNVTDVSMLYAAVKNNSLPQGYALECSNPNGGDVDIVDVAIIYAHVKGTRNLW